MSNDTKIAITGETGKVKWFDSRKGYGFILGCDGKEVFVHFSTIQIEGYRKLKDGVTVIYDAVAGANGWAATRVLPNSA